MFCSSNNSREWAEAMGKSKNAKPLTHEEIWDDSALVQSWDEAVEEYQLYHSIHAKGENVEDILREAQETGIAEEVDAMEEGGEGIAEDDAMEAENSMIPNEAATDPVSQSEAVPPQSYAAQEPAPAAAPGPGVPTGAMPTLHPALSQVQDEELKNLMMAWYFAGYYTGIYEGKQQANKSKNT
ncbi:hypothetical protein NUU61_009734 [Penicillium alfredii]|uniref:Survival Motor Neuron Gemin2-binding domain-containing protein n=1 Tax=Penicillium alfredii TaxID=1506179 RepID=A0A9W9EGU3_9EURO|nr:uncharacterized protein NUU61_009734 [Penicillium alfredii]KAJ5081470.1 hypothetical protein NUU61_009734 [Penicillium alfredii]